MRRSKLPTVSIALVLVIVVASMTSFLFAASRDAQAEPAGEETKGFSQAIADLIANVSLEKLYTYIYDLQNFTTRFFSTTNLNDSGEYISNHYAINASNLIVESQYFEYGGFIVRNIIATLPAFNPNNKTVYIVGGHYDSICLTSCQGGIDSFTDPYTPALGADDDATGTAVAMEAARIMSKYRYNATIVFAAWTLEELGLIGSEYYAAKAAESRMDIGGMLQFDMVGNDPANTKGLDIGYNTQSIWLANKMVEMNNLYSIGLVTYTGTAGGGSDHASFWAHGFPATMTIEHNFSPNWHRLSDNVSNLNMNLVDRSTKLAVATLAELAGFIPPGVGTLILDRTEYRIPDTVNITLYDSDLNTNPGAIETASVNASSPTEPLGEIVTMTETGIDSDIFTGSIVLTDVPTSGELEVVDGDIITVEYTDLDPPGTRTATATVDDVIPIISDVLAIPGIATATISWSTNEDATSRVEYNTSPPLLQSGESSELVIQHSIDLYGLTPNTTYYFDVRSSDAAGNTAFDDNGGAHYSFRTLSGISSTPEYGYVGWVRDEELTGNHFTDPQILVGHSDKRPPTYDVTYKGAAQFHTAPIPPGATILEATVSFYGNEWVYQEVVGDWNLELLNISIDSNWVNHAYPDISGAAVDAVILPTMSNSALKVGSWNTFYFTPDQYPILRDRVNTGNVSFRIDGPSPPGVINALIFAWSSGNKLGGGTSPEAPRLTIACSMTGDAVGPKITNELAAPNPTLGSAQVTLNATASDATTGNSGVVRAEYYVDSDPGMGSGVPMMPVDGGFDSDTEDAAIRVDVSLLSLGLHTVYVRAQDGAGNWGPSKSIILDVEPPDNEPPMIQNTTAEPSPQEMYGYVNISANITDNIGLLDGIAQAWVNITLPDGSWLNQSMDKVLDSYYHNASWDLLGTYDFVIWAQDLAGNWNSSAGQFEIIDTIRPVISGVSALPSPQEVGGLVNISATVTDNSGIVSMVSVEVKSPLGAQIGNFTMASSGSLYYDERAYGLPLGTYAFTIWVNDTSDNWESASDSFVVRDATLPQISGLSAAPTPSEVYGAVNISATVIDNVDVSIVSVEVRDPSMALVGNFTMAKSGSLYYDERTYGLPLGTYTYTIWANDTSDNWDCDASVFEVRDTTPPSITDVVEHPDPQELGGFVNITANVTDIVGVAGVSVNISGLGNFTMDLDSLSGLYFYNASHPILDTYSYIIWANDTSGNWNSTSSSFVIQDTIPPTASAGPDGQVAQGSTFEFNGSASTDTSGSIDNYTWNFTYNGTARTLFGSKPSFEFEKVGSYLVILTVRDPSGNPANDTMWVNVTGVDSDGDGLTDFDEAHIYGTDPSNPDTDGDGLSDGYEISQGTDPLVVQPKGEAPMGDYLWLIVVIVIVLVVLVLALVMLKRRKKPEEALPEGGPEVSEAVKESPAESAEPVET